MIDVFSRVPCRAINAKMPQGANRNIALGHKQMFKSNSPDLCCSPESGRNRIGCTQVGASDRLTSAAAEPERPLEGLDTLSTLHDDQEEQSENFDFPNIRHLPRTGFGRAQRQHREGRCSIRVVAAGGFAGDRQDRADGRPAAPGQNTWRILSQSGRRGVPPSRKAVFGSNRQRCDGNPGTERPRHWRGISRARKSARYSPSLSARPFPRRHG